MGKSQLPLAECLTPFNASLKVNSCRLADGEVRLLHNGDRVAFTPLPLDFRLGARPMTLEYGEARLGFPHALEFVYHKYAMDGYQAALSPSGNSVRHSYSEFDRIRRALRPLRSYQCVSCRELTLS